MLDTFIVGNVNRNQPRKRLDLTIQYFSEWIKAFDVRDAWLWLHVAPTGDEGYDVAALARYYGIVDRLITTIPQVFYGATESEMVDMYRSLDLLVSTTVGEGMGLTALEAMACGVPCILPDWSAFGDWARDAARLIPCSTTAAAPVINTIGGIADKEEFVHAMHYAYTNERYRKDLGEACLQRAREPRFRWRNVGEAFRDAIDGHLALKPHAPTEAEWKDLGRAEAQA